MHLNENSSKEVRAFCFSSATAVLGRKMYNSCTTVVIVRQRVSECRSNAAA